MRKLLLLLAVFFAFVGHAQLSDLHYLPPLKQGQNRQGIDQQAIYLSTPEPTTFTVNAYRGTNATPIATFNISKMNPAVYNLGRGDNNITLVNNANTGIVLTNSGLRFESPSGNKFYVNYRGSSSAQSASLTSKGRQSLGQRFKWGGVPNLGSHASKSNTLGIMATEDNTIVRLFGYDQDCEFRVNTNRAGITDDTYTVTLDANESFVFETYIGTAPTQAHEDGWIGATIEADKDIVISNGAINFGRQVGASNRDAGIDQPVPESKLGKEYVFVRGNGNANGWTEFPLVIAIDNNTQIYVNDETLPIATINEGEYYEIPSSYFSANIAGANMLVKTSKDVYAYQCMAGASTAYTQGLNFVAPVNCLLPDVMDNIPDIRNMAGTSVTGGVTIIAAVNTPDANIVVTDGNGLVTLPASTPVSGSSDWKTFYIPNLNGNVDIQSTGPMAVGFFGFNGARGVAGYFSGFDTVPEVVLEIRGGTGCFVGSEIYEASSNFDAYQWFEDGILIPGANGVSYEPSGAGDFFVRGTKGPCTYDSNAIRALYCDPDIVINKSVDNPEIMEGETATFTIKVRNLGVGPITNLQLTDNLPAGLSFVSAFTIDGSWSGNTWNIGTLDGGLTAELELEVRGDEIDMLPLVNILNTVSHTQDQADTNISEDIPSSSIIVHNDFDNDGIRDITDVDDDNDGIYDSEECSANICFEAIVNESFEDPIIPASTWRLRHESIVPGWLTTATDGQIEFWSDNFLGVPAFDGNQFAELNATQNSALYQNLCLTPGTVMNWSLRHRGRAGTDVMRLRIGADLASATVQGTMTDGNTAWGLHSGTYTVPLGQTNTVFIFEAVSTATGSLSVGNLIDDIKINIAAAPVCQDTDNDGIPDSLDLDSDGDGCSDANEYYKDENADGGDGGEYGTGTPAVNPDGSVIAAPYIPVFAPEILLGNTSEDLGGADINGQDVSLGQTFEYVLRFQNTGNDNAVNYSIRDILPNNVTFNDVDVSNAPGTTFTFDLPSQTLTLNVPDELVEVGDPEYSVRIEITIALNCSDFVAACSSTLENNAFSTYQGVLNNSTFTDEGGSNSIAGCPQTPNIASNSIFNDLTNCNQARTVQLCGDNVILAAGSGFTTYNWVLDANGNGQVDSSETTVNDGDPDNDASTLLVTAVGDYIVEKSSNGSCPDLVERIKVERFGTTQTNPIVDYFNQVNTDNNPDNDLQGEIVTCSIDGDNLAKIFLCGADDEATIQLGITDAQSIVWQKLNEGSCSSTGDDCANKNGTCTWSTGVTQDNFTVSESGEYRVVINYQNGCFSRFYFNVFKNALDVAYTAQDIICTTDGSIRITNVGTGYGFQLIDATNDNIIIPFSANNGPNFDIDTNGTYKVQVTQLDPSTNTPISGSCLFETEDIGIQLRDFSVNLTSTAADCNELGTVSVQALNAQPNYSYELRLDDGTNGGLGSLVSNQPALNDDTYVFSNVNPNDYIVVTQTDDGCLDSQQIVVNDTPNLNLVATNSQNITCASGIATLTPSGGATGTTYQMAIWSKDGVDLYTSTADILAADLQTTPNILFRDSTDAGDYEFVVIDSNGCFAISNSITIEDLGSPVITATNTTITCADTGTANLTINVTGGITPYRYSLDGGVSFQTVNTFNNLAAGFFTITVMDSSDNGGVGCVETADYEVVQPFRLTASPSIIEDAFCNPSGALVKILNPNGGQGPYEFSFNGGSSFSTVDELRLLSGSYQLVLRDALGCSYDMDITVPNPIADPSFNQLVDYNCSGLGTITMTPSNTSDFEYTYTLNGTLNTPAENNIFTNVTTGTQTVTVGYTGSITPSQSTLFFEDFGSGPNTQIGEIGPGYCYEPQDGSTTNCNLGPAGVLVDGEYTITNNATNPLPAYRTPNDHTAITDGRFLVIHPSNNLVSLNSIVWNRTNIEVLPNRDIDISFWAYNLRQTGTTGNNPEITIELVDASGNVLSSFATNEIPKNNDANDWHSRGATLNPGANTSIGIVLRSSQLSDDGNELILDDILASQTPEICEKSADIAVVVESGQAFEATLLSTIDPSCNTGADGAIRFEVANFDIVTGFEYSTDGGTSWTTSLVSPVTTPANFAAGSYTVDVRKVADNTCSTNFPTTLNAPAAIIPQLNLVADYSCFNTGATLEASATGGNPAYEFQLEDTSGTPIALYQNNPLFTNISDGDYLVRVRDTNGCEVLLGLTDAVTVDPPAIIAFDVAPIACYDGQNNASIAISVTDGNGGYTFRVNGGAWMTPAVPTDVNYTFTGLSNSSYDIEVSDSFGCVSPVETVLISPILLAQIDVVDVSSCGDGSITVNATGGDGNFVYAYMPTGNIPTLTDFVASNTFNVILGNEGDYDVYVWDNNGIDPHCQFLETVTVEPAVPLVYTATPTAPECHDGTGLISVNITTGNSPYTIELIDLDNGGASDQVNINVVATTQNYFNLAIGRYTIIVTDANGCDLTETPVTIDNPDELSSDIVPILPPNCDPNPNLYGFEFDNYPASLGTLEFSSDGGSNWQAADTFVGAAYASGAEVEPSIRVVGSNCQIDLPRYTIPYPLDDLGIDLSAIVVDCNDLQVTVQGTRGSAPYQYTYTDNPVGFDPNDVTTVWTAAAPGDHTFTGLVPGRTYIFYVRDASPCVRQSSVNVNSLAPPPIQIDGIAVPTCDSVTNGQITYTVTENTLGDLGGTFDWSFYRVSNTSALPPTLITTGTVATFTSGDSFVVPNPASLIEGDYFVEIRGAAPSNCAIGSENLRLEQLDPITFTPNVLTHITCADPGLVEIQNPQGGGGTYTFTLSSTNFITDIVSTDNPIEVPITNLIDVTATPFNVLIEIIDQYNCPVTTLPSHTVSMDISQSPTISSITTSNCTAPFSITVSATGGNGPYLYSIDGGTNYLNNGGIFNNVAIGSYAISILDSYGCTASDTADIYPTLQASVVQTKNLDCSVSPDAIINISGTSGSGLFEYEIAGPVNQVRTALPSPANSEDWSTTVTGTYTVFVYDTNTPTCPARSFTVEVLPEVLPDFTPSPTDVSCNNGSDGTIAITENNNGNNPLTYSLVPNNGSYNAATSTYENLPMGTYEITATGPNGCETVINNIQVNEPNLITFDAPVVTPFGCSSGNTKDNAIITIDLSSIAGGSGNYTRYQFIENGSGTVLQNGLTSSYTFTNNNGGNVRVLVIDENGCNGEVLVNVPAYDILGLPTVHVDEAIACSNPGEDISIDVSSSVTSFGANPTNYEFKLATSAVFQASNLFVDLQPGSYTFIARNIATGCELNVSHTVADPNTFDVTVAKIADAICFGDDGSITLSITDATYTGGFTWEIFNSNGTPADRSDDGVAILTGNSTNMGPTAAIAVPAGNYIVEVVQNAFPDCSQVRSFSITTPPAPLTLDTITQSDVGCSNDQGSASVNPLGGMAPYDIQLTNTSTSVVSNANGVNSNLFQGLTAGQYTLSVTDALGCNQVFTNAFELLVPDPIDGTISTIELVCQDDTNASISLALDARNVTSTYRYILNSFTDATGTTIIQSTATQVGGTFDNLSAGFYSIEVLDTMGCTFISPITEIVNPTEVNAQLLTTQAISCNQGATLSLSAQGGTAPYEWSVDGTTFNPMNGLSGANSHEFQNVLAGTYQYFVIDSEDCISVISNEVTITAIEDLTVVLDTSAAFINCNGESSALIDATADGGLGNYRYGLFADIGLTNEIRPYQTGGLFVDLPQGTYYVSVLSEDCQVTSEVVNITEPELMVVTPTITDVLCNGDDNGSIVITMEGGTLPYQYAISPNLNQFDDANSFEDLAPGDYSVIVQDSKGCFELIEFTITEPEILEMEVVVTPEYCVGEADGTITITPTGGTAPYSTSLNSNNSTDYTEDLLTYTNLTSGDYIVFIKDANGCETNQTVNVDEGVNINATVEVIYDCPDGTLGNSIQVTLEDRTERLYLLFALDSTDPNDLQLEPDFTNIAPGSHTLTIAHDNGCTRTFPFEVEAFEPLRISLEQQSLNEITVIAAGGREGYTFLFNGVDNGDDDTFYIKETGNYEVTVLDENGCAATANIFMEFIDIEIPNFFTPDGDGQNDIWIPRNIEQFPELFLNVYDRYGRMVYRLADSPEGWDGFYQENTLPTGDYWYVIKLNGEDDTREFVGNFTLYR